MNRIRNLAVALAPALVWACQAPSPQEQPAMGIVQFLSPEGLHANPAFSQVVRVDGPHRTVYIGGQNAVDADGNLIGPGNLVAQAEQVAANLEEALAAAEANLEDVVKWTIYVVEGQPTFAAFGVFQERWGTLENPPTISVVSVAGLAHPHFLLEVEGIAIVPTTR